MRKKQGKIILGNKEFGKEVIEEKSEQNEENYFEKTMRMHIRDMAQVHRGANQESCMTVLGNLKATHKQGADKELIFQS